MKNRLKIIAALFAGSAITYGGTAIVSNQTVEVATASKQAVLEQYVDAEVRLNEVPTLDLATASTEEMSAAYASLATKQNVLDPKQPNVFISLHDEAVKTGTACK